MKDLYTFSKNAWHVRLFKWIYGTDPTKTFNTMCPYFWALVLTILLLPLILVVKMFGKAGTKSLSKLESYKRDKEDIESKAFVEKYSKATLSDKEAYELYISKVYSKYHWYLEYKVSDKIYVQYCEYSKLLRSKPKFKDSKTYKFTSYLVVSTLVAGILYILTQIDYKPVDWDFFKVLGILISVAIAFAFLIIGFMTYVAPLLHLPRWVGAPFIFIGKGILIVGDMIYMTYKRACPRITWQNNDNK